MGASTLGSLKQSTPVALRGADVRWLFHPTCPPDWDEHVARDGGGFFHTPPGLAAGAPPGDRVFARLMRGKDVMAIASGVRSRCRLSRQARHFYFPSLPAVRDPELRPVAVTTLLSALLHWGAAEAVIDSFDAAWSWPPGSPDVQEPFSRQEYLVALGQPEEERRRSLATGHLRRGDAEGWSLDLLFGDRAVELLAQVQRTAAERAAIRGDPFAPALPLVASNPGVPGTDPWGVATFVASRGDVPLAAALVGWAAGRAFYLVGGSTAAGYDSGAGVWLHWRVMARLADVGFTLYNLGGTPTRAAEPNDPAHGLYRFKRGFGGAIAQCRGLSWTPRALHGRVHRLARWLTGSPT